MTKRKWDCEKMECCRDVITRLFIIIWGKHDCILFMCTLDHLPRVPFCVQSRTWIIIKSIILNPLSILYAILQHLPWTSHRCCRLLTLKYRYDPLVLCQYMNIEDVETMRIRMMLIFTWSWSNLFLKLSKGNEKLSRGKLDFEQFSYFENGNFRHN